GLLLVSACSDSEPACSGETDCPCSESSPCAEGLACKAGVCVGWDRVVTGWDFSCGVATDGTAMCWGFNGSGQSAPPADRFVALSAGHHHACGLRLDGTLTCWGSISEQPPAGSFESLAEGGYAFSCATAADGSAACWGQNNYGQTMVPELSFRSVEAGLWHACGILDDQTVVCWGCSDAMNQDCVPLAGQTDAPPGTFTQLSAHGQHFNCGIRTDATLACWGAYTDNADREPPTGEFISVSVGQGFICAVRSDNVGVCWGSAWASGQLEVPTDV